MSHDSNASLSLSSTQLRTAPLSNATLESAFQELLRTEASPVERDFLLSHPWLYTYALLCFVRGWDRAIGHYDKILNKLVVDD